MDPWDGVALPFPASRSHLPSSIQGPSFALKTCSISASDLISGLFLLLHLLSLWLCFVPVIRTPRLHWPHPDSIGQSPVLRSLITSAQSLMLYKVACSFTDSRDYDRDTFRDHYLANHGWIGQVRKLCLYLAPKPSFPAPPPFPSSTHAERKPGPCFPPNKHILIWLWNGMEM